MTVRILIADDHAVFRSGLRAFLEKEKGFRIVGEAADGAAALEAVRETPCDVLVLDIRMPGPPVARTIAAARRARSRLGVVVLTMFEDAYYLREALRAGATGFVLKRSTASDVVRAIRAAAEGEVFVDPVLAHHLAEPPAKGAAWSGGDSALSPRETEILIFLARGHTNVEIAARLSISPRTVETHRARIMEKLGIETRAEITAYAVEKGLFTPT